MLVEVRDFLFQNGAKERVAQSRNDAFAGDGHDGGADEATYHAGDVYDEDKHHCAVDDGHAAGVVKGLVDKGIVRLGDEEGSYQSGSFGGAHEEESDAEGGGLGSGEAEKL